MRWRITLNQCATFPFKLCNCEAVMSPCESCLLKEGSEALAQWNREE